MTPEARKLIAKMAGSKGGFASAKRMTKAQRKARARNAGLARLRRRRDRGGYWLSRTIYDTYEGVLAGDAK
jgi:hypothetical protein